MTIATEALTRPQEDEFELSLFGPGRGECVVLHLGGGNWIVVDSCLDRDTHNPIALDYLGALNVDVAKSVRMVVVTHCHDDHIQGASQVFDAAEGAELVCSDALRSEEFLTFLRSGSRVALVAASSGADEFSYILDVLRRRKRPGQRAASIGPQWARADQVLLRQDSPIQAKVVALSPSSETLTLAKRAFESLIPAPGAPKRRLVAQSPNEVTLVLWVAGGDVRALLGSDLEESASPGAGWRAIVASTTRPQEQAQILKVPHHGSENAHNDEVWEKLLSSRPFAVLTPFLSGERSLPTVTDLDRLKARTDQVYLTSPSKAQKPMSRSKTVERTIKEAGRELRVVEGQMGHVRLRSKSRDGAPSIHVELFQAAHRLT